MPIIVLGGASGATVRVKCPHCGKVQVRARGKRNLRCSGCHEPLEPPQRAKGARPVKRPPP